MRTLLLILALLSQSPGSRPSEPESRAASMAGEASSGSWRDALRAGSHSLSLGAAVGGSLTAGVAAPLQGPTWRFLPRVGGRDTNHATAELWSAVRRASELVAARFPGSVLLVGNMSLSGGGKIPFSVSHSSGRDVDLLFYVATPKGRHALLRDFLWFGEDGKARSGKNVYVFDVQRNWALVRALVTDPDSQVQWIFVARHLKAMLLAHASAFGESEEVLRRAELVLHQPRDSSAHADHFHVRIACPLDDMLRGCNDWPPVWDWMDAFETERAGRVGYLVARLGARGPDTRRKALATLLAMVAVEAAGDVAASLAETTDAAWAAQLAAALEVLPARGSEGVLMAVLARPGAASGMCMPRPAVARAAPGMPEAPAPRLAGTPEEVSSARAAAARALARLRAPEAVACLAETLDDPCAAVRCAASSALEFQTTYSPGACPGTRASARAVAAHSAAWRRWIDLNRGRPWQQWVRDALARRGVTFQGKMLSPSSVPPLVAALPLVPVQLSWAVQDVLGDLTGHRYPKTRDPGADAAHWKDWLEPRRQFFK